MNTKRVVYFFLLVVLNLIASNVEAVTIDCDLARIYLSKGYNDSDYYKKAIELCAGYIRPYELYGNELRKKGLKKEAIQYFQSAAELGSTNYKLYYQLALLHFEFEEYDLSIKYLSNSIDIKKKYDKAIILLKKLRQKKDHKGPIIKFYDLSTEEINRVAFFYDEISIRGSITDLSKIIYTRINGVKITINDSGNFIKEISLKPGQNVILIEAADILNNISKRSIMIYRATSIVDQRLYNNKFAVTIGINDYEHLPHLDAAVNDATSIKNELVKKKFTNVIEILNKNATRPRILTELYDRLPKMVGRDDLLVFYFAGHGMTQKLSTGKERGFIIPVESKREDYTRTAISMQQIKGLCHRISAKHIIFIMDCCYSGQILYEGEIDLTIKQNVNENLQSRRVIEILTAGTKNQTVMEMDSHGLFTKHLLNSIQGKADINRDQVITGMEIGNFLIKEVTKASNSKQTPVFSKIEGNGDIYFFLKNTYPDTL